MPEKKSSGLGCFLFGCGTVVVLVIVAGIAVYYGVQSAVGFFVQEFTDDKPRLLAPVEYSDDYAATLLKRVDDFRHAIEQEQPTAPLVLSTKDVNVLIAKLPELQQLRDIVRVKIVNEKLTAEVSVPLEFFSEFLGPKFKGRYLNGNGSFRMFLEQGHLVVMLQSLEVHGKKGMKIPEEILKDIKRKNLVDDMKGEGDFVKFLNKLKSIRIRNSELILEGLVSSVTV